MGRLRFMAVIISLVLVALSLFFAPAGSTYRWSFVFLVPLAWLPFFWRKGLALHPLHYFVFGLALLTHGLGTFGMYEKTIGFFRFDSYIHFLFGFAAGLIIYHALQINYRLSRLELSVAMPLLILGIGGIHELFECATTLWLGPEKGMLKLRPGEPFDTQKDLMNNLLGALIALLGYIVAVRQRRRMNGAN